MSTYVPDLGSMQRMLNSIPLATAHRLGIKKKEDNDNEHINRVIELPRVKSLTLQTSFLLPLVIRQGGTRLVKFINV